MSKQKLNGMKLIDKTYNKDCILTYDVFKTKKGQMLLERLVERYIKQPVSHHEWTERYSCQREGENMLIRALFKMYKHGSCLIAKGQIN